MSGSPSDIAVDFARRWEDAWNSGGATAVAALYTPDALFVGHRHAAGRAAVAAVLQGVADQGWTAIRITVADVRRLGDAVLVACDYTAFGTGAQAGKGRDARSSHVLTRVDGEWRSAMHTAT